MLIYSQKVHNQFKTYKSVCFKTQETLLSVSKFDKN